MQSRIKAAGLVKSFGEHAAVNGVTLDIASGEIYGLVGSDGAGKTTTIRMLVGALKPDAGACSVAGFDLSTQTEAARAQIGYLSQRFSLYEDLTVLENIRFFAEVRGMRTDEWRSRCLEILEFVGLAGFKDRRAGQLSGGMRQKLGLASALVIRPRVLLLDEPTTGVDPVTRQDFWQLLIGLVSKEGDAVPNGADSANADGVAVLISTPYMDEAARCHRVGFMRHGKIIAEDTPTQLRGLLADRVLELRGSPSRLLRRVCEDDESIEAVRAFGDRLHLRVSPGGAGSVVDKLRARIERAGGHVEYLQNMSPTLEDVFIYLSETAYE
jgi:ABC-2 type transport system ATP-binding protein